MASSIPALVEPAILQWARESIGLTAVGAARKMGLPDDRVAQWESGDAQPTVTQLRKAAAAYKRPLGVFFLPEPPKSFDAMRDFRRQGSASAVLWSPELHAEFRRAQLQRENALELFDIEDEEPPTVWRIEELPDDDEGIAAVARVRLLSQAMAPLPKGTASAYAHLNTWISALEETGVLVMATSRGAVLPTEMRAFSLYFDLLPVIALNGADWPRGRLFSLLHEYAHLVLHTSGLCDTVTDLRATTPDRKLEARCNAIAAAILMPAEQMLAEPAPESWTYETLARAATPFGVSAEAFLRRLVTVGRVPLAFYQRKRDEFVAAYEDDQSRSGGSGGGNWYRNTARDLGKGYVRRVTDAHRRRVIDSYTAASFLNVKVGQIPRLAEAAVLAEASV
ncbi:XRE family transcriptional regulator [Mycobacterium avium]|nr:XRE family transcriptional regulator [Mycobacterium avium]